MTDEQKGMGPLAEANEFSSGNAPQTVGLGERIAGVLRNRGGRPKGSKNKPRPEVDGKNRVASVSRNVERDAVVDQKANCSFFVETALFLFVSGDEFVKRALLDRVRNYEKDETRVREFETMVYNKYAFTEADRERLKFLLLQLALKYPILQKVGPEIGLLVFVVQYGMRTLQLVRAIEGLKPRKKVEPSPTPAPATA